MKKQTALETSNGIILLKILSLLFCSTFLTAQEKSLSQVEIPGTQVHKIKSMIVDQEYVLHIQLPMNYEKSKEKFPVVYVIDSQWDFPLINAVYGEQYYDGFLPELIIVGITWGGENPNYDDLRSRDLTPVSVQQSRPTGNASKFLEFIKTELIPYINSKFKADKNDIVLMGSSYGGLFTLYTLFTESDLFSKYILTSPAFLFANGFIFSYADTFATQHSKLPVKIFAAIGEYEDVGLFNKYFEKIKSHNYEGIELETKVIANTGHSGNKAEGYSRGLQYVFARPKLKLSDEILNQYIGSYQMNMGPSLKISTANNQLVAEVFGSKVSLLAASETDFYVKGFFAKVHFEKDENGKVTGAQIKQFGSQNLWKKME